MKISTFVFLLASVFCGQLATAQTTFFTYQGRLTDGGNPASGLYDLRFALWDDAAGGIVVAGPVTNRPVAVSNGVFTVTLDFGSEPFGGGPRWLAIGVRPFGNFNSYTSLTPRQSIDSAPYAIQAATAAALKGTLSDAQLSANIPRLSSSITFTSGVSFNPASGSPFTISGSSSNKLVKGLNADKLGGKDVTNFVQRAGDTMTGPLNLPTNGLAAGGNQFVLSNGNVGIGTTNPGLPLQVNRNGATADIVWNAAYFESVKTSNMADGFGTGVRFRIQDDAAVENTIAEISAVRDGADNSGKIRLFPYSAGLQVTGVQIDHLGNVGIGTTSAGAKLEIDATRTDVPGGQFIAFGQVAKAGFRIDTHNSFNIDLWNGASWSNPLTIEQNTGNVGIGTTTPQARLHVVGDGRIDGTLSYGNTTRQMLNLFNSAYGIGVQANREYFRSGSGFSWFNGGTHSDADNDPGSGGTRLMDIDHSGNLTVLGNLMCRSDFVMRAEAAPANQKSWRQHVDSATYYMATLDDNNANENIFFEVDRSGQSVSSILFRQGNVGIGTVTPETSLQVHSQNGYGGMTLSAQGLTTKVKLRVTAGDYGFLDLGGDTQLRGNGQPSYFEGNFGIGTTTPESRLTVYESKTNGGTEAAIIIQDYSNTDSGTDFIKALEINKFKYNIPDGVTASGYQVGISPQVFVFDANFSGTIDKQYAIWARTGMRTIGASGARTINNAYGIYIEGLTEAGGTINNHYGVYQQGSGTKNYFEGNLGIGTTSPAEKLYVAGGKAVVQGIDRGAIDPALFGSPSTGTFHDMLTQRERGLAGFGVIETSGVDSPLIWMHNGAGNAFHVKNVPPTSSRNPATEGQTLFMVRNDGNVGIGTTTPSAKLEVAGEVRATVFTPTSDRNAKENFSSVNTRSVLEKVSALPITRWNFKELPGAEHVGPMAQDFYAAFGMGADDKHIATVDADGVALAAIQGLNEILNEQEADLQAKDKRIESLENRLTHLEKLLSSVMQNLKVNGEAKNED